MRLRDGAVVCNCENQLHTGDEKRPEYIQTRFSSVLLKCAIVQEDMGARRPRGHQLNRSRVFDPWHCMSHTDSRGVNSELRIDRKNVDGSSGPLWTWPGGCLRFKRQHPASAVLAWRTESMMQALYNSGFTLQARGPQRISFQGLTRSREHESSVYLSWGSLTQMPHVKEGSAALQTGTCATSAHHGAAGCLNV